MQPAVRPRTILLPRRALFIFLAFILAAFLTLPAVAEYLGPERTRAELVTVRDPDHDIWTLINDDPPFGILPVCLIIHTCDQHPGVVSYGPACLWGDNPAEHSSCSMAVKEELQEVTYPEATITAILQDCNSVGGWCTSSPTLHLTANEPVAGESIMLIEGTRNGKPFACSGVVCNVPLLEGSNEFTFWALSTWGDSSQMGTFSALVDSLGPTLSIPDAWYIWEPLAIGVDDGGVGIDRVKLTIDGGSYGDRSYAWSLSNLPDKFIWDRHIGEVIAPIGEYPVTVQAWDVLGNSTTAAGLILIPAPEGPEATEEVSEPVSEPGSTDAPEPTAPPIPSGLVIEPTATNEPLVAASVDEAAASFGPAEPSTTTTSTEGGSGTLLWGAAALAAAASATAYALSRRQARAVEIEKMRKEAAESASPSAFARRLSTLWARAQAIAAPIRHSMIVAAAAAQAAVELARQRAEQARRQRAEQLRAEREERAEQAERRAALEVTSTPALEDSNTSAVQASEGDAWQRIELQRAQEYAGYSSPPRPSLLRDPLGWVQTNLINAGRSNDTVRGLLTSAAVAWDQIGAPLVQTAGEFSAGVGYQAIKNNLEPIGWISIAIVAPVREDFRTRVAEFEAGFPDSSAFYAGRLVGGLLGLAESVAIWGHGGSMVGGGVVTCGTGVLCGAGAPAIALGSLEIAAGFAVAGASLHGLSDTFTYFADRYWAPPRVPPPHRKPVPQKQTLQQSLEMDQPRVPWDINSFKRPGDVPPQEIGRMGTLGKIIWTVARVVGLIEVVLGYGDGPPPSTTTIPPAPMPLATSTPSPTPTNTPTSTSSPTSTPTETPTPTATDTPSPTPTGTPTSTPSEASGPADGSDYPEPYSPYE